MTEPITSNQDDEEEEIEKLLTLIFEEAIVEENGYILGYEKGLFESNIQDSKLVEDVINQMESQNLMINSESEMPFSPIGLQLIESQNPVIIAPTVVACEWYGMKESAAYTKAQNNCIYKKLKENYGLATVASTIANLIADKNFKLAAKEIIKLGVRSNIAGIIVTLGIIQVSCNNQMAKQFPGKTNCVK